MTTDALDRQLHTALMLAKSIEQNAHAVKRKLDMTEARLADALDAIHELKIQIITKDNIIAELQVLQKTGIR